MNVDLTRRSWLASIPAMGLAASSAGAAPARRLEECPFLFGLNTSTISGQKLPIAEVVAVAGKAGYNALEPWVPRARGAQGLG